jgi:hypothetical protein
MRRWDIAIVLLIAACGRIGFDPINPIAGDAGLPNDSDVPSDAAPPISPFMPFSNVQVIDELVAAGEYRDHPTLSPDMLTMYLTKDSVGSATIWYTERESLIEPWMPIALVPDLNSGTSDTAPNLSPNGLVMHFASDRGGASNDLYVATRAQVQDPWGNITPISELNTVELEHSPTLTPNGLRMVFDRDGELFESTRGSTADPWGSPVPLTELNRAGFYVGDGELADGGLTLYFDSEFAATGLDLYVTTRPSLDAPFEAPAPMDTLNTSGHESDPWLSPDGRTLFFARSSSETEASIYTATR